MRTPYLSKGFHLLGIALLSLSLIALGFSMYRGLPRSAVIASVNPSREQGEIDRPQDEPRRESPQKHFTPSDLEKEVLGGASELRASSDAEDTGPENTADADEKNTGGAVLGRGKSNSPSEEDRESPDLTETLSQQDAESTLPILPADHADFATGGTEQATPSDADSGDENNADLVMRPSTPNAAKWSDQSSETQTTFKRDTPDSRQTSQQSERGSKGSESVSHPAIDTPFETKSPTLARLDFNSPPFLFASDDKWTLSNGSFRLVSDSLRKQTLGTDEAGGLPLPSASETPTPSLFSPVVVTGLPPRMQTASQDDFSDSNLVTKQAATDVGVPSFSDQAPLSAPNQTAENLADLPNEPPAIAENAASKSSYELIEGDDSRYEPLVSRPVESSSSSTTARSGDPQPRLAMLQTPSPSSSSSPTTPTSDPAKKPESETSEPAAPTPTKEAEDDGEHMISELVGSCYGCFSRVFDSGLYASNEFTFLSTSSIGDVRVGITDMLSETTVSESSKSAIGFGNRTTIGIRGAFAGLRARYWTFGANQEITDYGDTTQAIPKFVSASGVDAETVDLEITQPFCIFGCRFESSVGARYADYRANDAVLLVDQMHNSLELTGIAKASRQITGAGPTLALAGRKNLRIGFGGLPGGEFLPDFECSECGSSSCMGECDTWRSCHGCFPWNIYWNGRISWLWADESSAALTEASVFQHDGNSNIASARSRDKAAITDDSDSSIYTLSFQIGLEYCRPILCRSQLVIRAGFEYQHWDLGKNVAESQSFAFLTDNSNFGGRVDSIAQSHKNYVDLAGFTLMLGLNY